jgi:hypothetical protein
MKNRLKIPLAVLILFAVIQFFRPGKNFTRAEAVNDIAKKYDVPMNVLMNLYDGCYNCHSNYTTYPWYFNIQPVGWWMARHIKKAKRHLNFSEFATYTPEKAAKKFHEIYKVMDEKTMPLKSYLLQHKEARLTDEQYKRVADWAQKMHRQALADTDSAR